MTVTPSSPVSPAAPRGQAHRTSYGQIFRSTAWIGGASAIQIVLGIVRTKLMALWLGPSGLGLIGVYGSIVDLASTASSMGVNDSGVRQIAEASSSGDVQRIGITVSVLRRTALLLGVLGSAVLIAASRPVSQLTFGSTEHAWAVAVLASTVLFGSLSGGQGALIQGMRRVADLAWIRVAGALLGTVIGAAVVWLWRDRGVVPMLVVLSFSSLLPFWWYARRIPVVSVALDLKQMLGEVRGLMSLGVAFMASALLSAGVAYFTRLVVIRELGIVAVGHFVAAYTLAGVYVTFILQAMGTDFFPRLSAVSRDNDAINRMVNEQAEISLLLTAPGVLATLTFSTTVIALFYSASFGPAVEVLRWQVLGVFGRVISWPLSYILLARGSRRMFLITELASVALHVALIWWGVRVWGLAGTGIALFGRYVFYSLLMLVVSRRESGFRWNATNARLILWILPTVAVVFGITEALPPTAATLAGSLVTVVAGWVCLKGVLRRVPRHRLGLLPFLSRWGA